MEELARDTEAKRQGDLLWIFDIGLILKGVDGLLEMVAAFIITAVPPQVVLSVADFITGGELSQEPDDLVGRLLQSAGHAFSVSNHAVVTAYLALHGVIKVALVAGIFAGKRIAYPLFMIALAIFGAYELFVGATKHHYFLLAVGVFDALLLFLTRYEYRRRYPVSA